MCFSFVKISWEEVKKRWSRRKGLPGDVADKLGEYVLQHKRGAAAMELLKKLSDSSSDLMKVSIAREGLHEMEQLLQYCEVMEVIDKVRIVERFEHALIVHCV